MIKFAIGESVQFDDGISQGEGYIEELGIISVFVHVTYSNNDKHPIGEVVQIQKRYTNLEGLTNIKDDSEAKLTNDDYKALIDIALDTNDFAWADKLRNMISKNKE